jgi:hypothetical protein
LSHKTLNVNGVVTNYTTYTVIQHKGVYILPPEQSLTWDLTRIGARIEEGLRIVDWEHAKEQLRMILVQALTADLQVCVPTLYGLEIEL